MSSQDSQTPKQNDVSFKSSSSADRRSVLMGELDAARKKYKESLAAVKRKAMEMERKAAARNLPTLKVEMVQGW
jgi:membrane protein insertase Oxa1/YidC/SpoIIIJ